MKTFGKILSALFVLALLAILSYAAYFGFNYFANIFAKLDQQVAIVTAIAAATVLLSAAMIASGLRWAKAREHDQQLRAQKAALYERFLQTWSEPLRASMGEMNFSEGLRALEMQLLLCAGPEVLQAYLGLQKQGKNFNAQSAEVSSQSFGLILAMRHDLGQSIQGLNKTDLLKLLGPSIEPVVDDQVPAVNNHHRKIRFPA